MSEQKKVTNNISIPGAKLVLRNFRGAKTRFNEEGNRTFGVLLPDELADTLADDGWNVKYFRAKEDDPDQYEQPWLSVKVKFEPYPPIIILINSRGKKRIYEETVDQLDWSIITNCDLIIRPYNYSGVGGRKESGVTAYLKAMYVTISEDEFAEKYADIPDLDYQGVVEDEEHED